MKELGQRSAGKEIHKKNILKFFHLKTTTRSSEMDDPREPEQLELFPETESEVKDIKVLVEDDGYHD
jgi:hypothetical protein